MPELEKIADEADMIVNGYAFKFKVAGYYLYFTSFCTVEAFHVHASDKGFYIGK